LILIAAFFCIITFVTALQYQSDSESSDKSRNVASTRVPENIPGEVIHLMNVQNRELKDYVLRDLNKNGRKTECWIWWVCPTSMPGSCDPNKVQISSSENMKLLLERAPKTWKQVLQKICELWGSS